MEILSNLFDAFQAPLLVLGIVFVILATISLVHKNWILVPPNKAAIIYGRKKRKAKVLRIAERGAPPKEVDITVSYRIVIAGATLKVPFIEKVAYIPLDNFTIPVEVDHMQTEPGVFVSVRAVANVKVGSDNISIASAAERFLTTPKEFPGKFMGTVQETLKGHLRGIVGKMTPEALYQDRVTFGNSIQESAEPELRAMGVQLDNMPIQEVSDDEAYYDSLARRPTAEVKRNAEIAEAGARRETLEKTSEAERIGKEAQYRNEAAAAEAGRDKDLKLAGFKAEVDARNAEAAQAGPLADAQKRKEVEVAQVQVEAATVEARIKVAEQEQERVQRELVATQIRPAEAERQAAVINAEGEAAARIKSAEGEANATERKAAAEKAKLEAEGRGAATAEQAKLVAVAEGKKQALLAEAEGKKQALLAEAAGEQALAEALKKKAEAYAMLDEAGVTQMVLDKLPEIFAAAGDALTKALGTSGLGASLEAMASPLGQIDNLTILDTGGGNGSSPLDRYAKTLPNLLFTLITQAKALGIDQLLDKIGLNSELLEKAGLGSILTQAEENVLKPPTGKGGEKEAATS